MSISYIAIPGLKAVSDSQEEDVIIKTICQEFKVSFDEVISKKRNPEYLIPRQIIIYFLMLKTRYTMTKIGKLMGGRDHTTVIHTMKRVRDIIDTEEDFKNKINYLLKLI